MGRDSYWPTRTEKEGTTPGCMSGMLHLLDFHHLLFTTHGGDKVAPPPGPTTTLVNVPSPQLKGLEAPRNSLELDDAAASTSSMANYFYDVPLGIQLPSVGESESDEKRISQAGTPRTPNVVARLMGLELLPDDVASSSPPILSRAHRPPSRSPPSHSAKKKKQRVPLQPRNCNIVYQAESRSLPETPRSSRDADPRLSLKENNYNRAMQEFSYLCEVSSSEYSSLPVSPTPHVMKARKKDQESKSPRSHGYHAREIVKQVKESISCRRVGGGGTDRSMKSTRPLESKPSPPPLYSPPRIRFLEPAKSMEKRPVMDKKIRPPCKGKNQGEAKGMKVVATSQCKKPCDERYMERIKKQASPLQKVAVTQNQFTRPDNRKLPVTSSLQLRPVNFSQEQINAASTCSTQNRQWCPQPKELDPEFIYIRSILDHAGLMTTTTTSWHSLSRPLDPIIFHRLELHLRDVPRGSHEAPHLNLDRCNRKLLFHLVDELLQDLFSTTDTWRGHSGETLLLRLWSRIRSFPAADCHVIGDIDALVEEDLPESKVRGLLSHPAVVDEAERVAIEVQESIFEFLVGEALQVTLR